MNNQLPQEKKPYSQIAAAGITWAWRMKIALEKAKAAGPHPGGRAHDPAKYQSKAKLSICRNEYCNRPRQLGSSRCRECSVHFTKVIK